MSEFRQNIVSSDWIIVAPERGRRPHGEGIAKRKRKLESKKNCPFEDLKKASPVWPPLYIWPPGGLDRWKIAVIPNKYPALIHKQTCASQGKKGPYPVVEGIGHHDLVITRDHYKNFAHLSHKDSVELLNTFKKRYNIFSHDPCLVYISTFFNWGKEAGATVYHPHYQILALPVIPPHISRSLEGSFRYYRRHRRCVHCEIIKNEIKDGKRIIFKTSKTICLVPFASKEPFQVTIFPLVHISSFEESSLSLLSEIASSLQKVMLKIEKNLGDPDLNFYIHSPPLQKQGKKKYSYYHWHIEVVPHIGSEGGFEISTGVDINVVDPDYAAKVLRK